MFLRKKTQLKKIKIIKLIKLIVSIEKNIIKKKKFRHKNKRTEDLENIYPRYSDIYETPANFFESPSNLRIDISVNRKIEKFP